MFWSVSSKMVGLIIRPINRGSEDELDLVAIRMRETLIEVLGRERGESMYTIEWLIDRARQHITPSVYEGEILLAELNSEIVGHCIVRVEYEAESRFGLFSTTYVIPSARRLGIARALVLAGETWFQSRRLPYAMTYTDEANVPLIELFEEQGYVVIERRNEFAVLKRLFDQQLSPSVVRD